MIVVAVIVGAAFLVWSGWSAHYVLSGQYDLDERLRRYL